MHRALLLSLAVSCLPAAVTPAAPAPRHPVVAGFERFHADRPGAEGGQLLLGELGCTACHTGSEAAKPGPVLDQVAGRVRTTYLRKFLSDPHGTKPGTTMPNLLADDPEREQKVEALVHFLATTGSARKEPARPKHVAAGREHYHKLGCFACHGTRDALGKADKVLPHSVPLGDLEAKYTIPGLIEFLKDPHRARPAGRMPRLLQGNEPRDVAHYLLQGVMVKLAAVKGVSRYAYYEGAWGDLPDFAKLMPAATGLAAGFDLDVVRRENNYALKFEGYFRADLDAEYTFSTRSDDGSQLFIDGKRVVDNGGTHAPETRQGKVKLKKGVHKVEVTFFQGPGGAELAARVEAPGFGNHDLAGLIAPTPEALEKSPPPRPRDPDYLAPDPALVARGKDLFRSLGCASCHTLHQGKERLTATGTAPPRAKLSAGKGCLAESPKAGVPWYSLGEAQTKSLAAALGEPAPEATPSARIAHTLTAFNCLACHARDKKGGPDEALNAAFLTTQPEMGDEGRVPPPLDGVGAKLKPEYFKNLLANGSDDRPYMYARMPGFGPGTVEHLVADFAATDKLPAVPEVKFKTSPGRVKAAGRHLVGGKGFSCFKCHLFAGVKAEGVQGIDMLKMPQRLRRDWFHAYVFDPQRVRPGTRMPSAFFEGKSLLDDVFAGEPAPQVEAMWLYLQDGTKARPPVGLRPNAIALVPKEGAILYRNFITGVGTRAIAVGYPESAHLAFDANGMRLALLWQGEFIDASRHWTGRGSGFEGPLGDNLLSLPDGVPFARLARPEDEWPKAPAKAQGYTFRGYRLTPDDRPTFLYSFGKIQVADFPNAVKRTDPAIRRALTLSAEGNPADLYFRAAVADKIEPLDGGWYRINGAWRMKVEGGKAAVRKAGGKTELLVPLTFTEGRARIVQEFVW